MWFAWMHRIASSPLQFRQTARAVSAGLDDLHTDALAADVLPAGRPLHVVGVPVGHVHDPAGEGLAGFDLTLGYIGR